MPTKSEPDPHEELAALYEEKARRARQELLRRRAETDLTAWVELYGRLETGRPFSFAGHEYLREPLENPHPYTVSEKCAQVGWSTLALLFAFRKCIEGWSVIYYFPTDGDVQGFSRTRAAPMLRHSPYLREKCEDQNNVHEKKIGAGILRFRGMMSGGAVRSDPADFIFFDELDLAPPDQKEAAVFRMEHSPHKWTWELSNPTIPDYGIDVEFQHSDMRYWLVPCDGCGEWTCLEDEFLADPEKLIVERPGEATYLACRACGRPLDPDQGQWVAKRPGITERRGYHMCGPMSRRCNLSEILTRWRNPAKRTKLMQYGMGIPYVDGKDRLEESAVLACATDYAEQYSAPPGSGCTMGCDVGLRLHFQVSAPGGSGKRRVLRMGTVGSFEELDNLMRTYGIRRAVVDAQPELLGARSFAKRFPGRVFRCYYPETKQDVKWDEIEYKVTVDRTESLDATKALFSRTAPRIELPAHSPHLAEYARHARALVKVEKVNESTGAKVFRYVRTSDDHWFHACNYDRLAWETPGFSVGIH